MSCAAFPLVELKCELMPLFRGLLEERSGLAEVNSAGKMEYRTGIFLLSQTCQQMEG